MAVDDALFTVVNDLETLCDFEMEISAEGLTLSVGGETVRMWVLVIVKLGSTVAVPYELVADFVSLSVVEGPVTLRESVTKRVLVLVDEAWDFVTLREPLVVRVSTKL